MNTNYIISTEEFASIEEYLLGETSGEERLVFENKMATDKEWADKVNEVKLLFTGIETSYLKERLDAYHSKLKKNPEKEVRKIFSTQRKWLVAASIAVLAVLSVWILTFRENKFEKLYATYYKPDPGLMSAMGLGDNYLFNKAMLDYKTGNYKKAISEWKKLSAKQATNDTLNYFLGAAQQADGNNAAALGLLQSIASDPANLFYKEACWYTGLALLKQGAVSEAIPYIEKSERSESTQLIRQLKQ